jgi:DNA-binding transcriptional regulator YiaG
MPRKPPPRRDWTRAISGQELKTIRETPPKLTRKQVAKEMDVHPNTIARWENERLKITKPMVKFFKLVCKLAKKAPIPP